MKRPKVLMCYYFQYVMFVTKHIELFYKDYELTCGNSFFMYDLNTFVEELTTRKTNLIIELENVKKDKVVITTKI